MIIGTETYKLDNVQRARDFGSLGLKWGVFTKPLPSRLRDLCRRREERFQEPEVIGDSKEAGFYTGHKADTHINSGTGSKCRAGSRQPGSQN